LLSNFLPIFEEKWEEIRKKSLIKAKKKAIPGNGCHHKTPDGVETKNNRTKGDMLVQNQTSSGKKPVLVKARKPLNLSTR